MTTNKDGNSQKAFTKSVTSFEGFLHQLRTAKETYQDIQCDGFAHFLSYDLGNLNKLAKGKLRTKKEGEMNGNENENQQSTNEQQQIQNNQQQKGITKGSSAQNPQDEERDESNLNQIENEVNRNDENTKVSGSSDESIPLPIPTYVPTREDYMQVINQVRIEIKKKIIFPISKASGYKWEYSKGHFKDEILLLEFHCFQDISKDMQPSKFNNSNLIEIYKIGQCASSVNVFINIITRQIRITYRHKSHTRLIDIIYSLLSQIYNE